MVKIRLRRMGAKKKPFYRIVVADSRCSRDGRFIEIIGYYDPTVEPPVIKLEKERAEYWLSNGAQPSDTTRALLKIQGLLGGVTKKAAEPKKKSTKAEKAKTEEAARVEEAPAVEAAPEPAPAETAPEAAPVEVAQEATPAESAPEAEPAEKEKPKPRARKTKAAKPEEEPKAEAEEPAAEDKAE